MGMHRRGGRQAARDLPDPLQSVPAYAAGERQPAAVGPNHAAITPGKTSNGIRSGASEAPGNAP